MADIERAVTVQIGSGIVHIDHTLEELGEAVYHLRAEAPRDAWVNVTQHAITARWRAISGDHKN